MHQKNAKYLFPTLFAIVCCAVSLLLRPFPHYAMVLLPIFIMLMGQSVAQKKNLWLAIGILLMVGINWGELYSSVMRTRREVLLHRAWFEEGYKAFDGFAEQLSDDEKGRIFNFIGWPGMGLLNRNDIVEMNRNTITLEEEEFKALMQTEDASRLPAWLILSTAKTLSDETTSFIQEHYTDTVEIGEIAWCHAFVVGLDATTIQP